MSENRLYLDSKNSRNKEKIKREASKKYHKIETQTNTINHCEQHVNDDVRLTQ